MLGQHIAPMPLTDKCAQLEFLEVREKVALLRLANLFLTHAGQSEHLLTTKKPPSRPAKMSERESGFHS